MTLTRVYRWKNLMDKTHMIGLAQELLQRANSGKIDWEVGPMRNAFGVALPDMSIMITRDGPLYILSLLAEGKTAIDRLYSSKPFEPEYHLLQKIYDLARGKTAPQQRETVAKAMGYLKASQHV